MNTSLPSLLQQTEVDDMMRGHGLAKPKHFNYHFTSDAPLHPKLWKPYRGTREGRRRKNEKQGGMAEAAGRPRAANNGHVAPATNDNLWAALPPADVRGQPMGGFFRADGALAPPSVSL
ncbi:hypothetical protein AVEN_242602-1 [Araneus ventricosus]|uniref:Uncharacterized protein n=1 Tax=Araneus ventricosus TaxID=182803 RepID=A0A4Y2ESP0_ARAVE|nr:hypothetical protein AVEN_242602-1 [Araneus ventricosus]